MVLSSTELLKSMPAPTISMFVMQLHDIPLCFLGNKLVGSVLWVPVAGDTY